MGEALALEGGEENGRNIGHFTVVCSATWPRIGNEAGGDLVLIQTSLFFIYKCKLVSIRRE